MKCKDEERIRNMEEAALSGQMAGTWAHWISCSMRRSPMHSSGCGTKAATSPAWGQDVGVHRHLARERGGASGRLRARVRSAQD